MPPVWTLYSKGHAKGLDESVFHPILTRCEPVSGADMRQPWLEDAGLA